MPYVVHRFNGERLEYDAVEPAARAAIEELLDVIVPVGGEVPDDVYEELYADTVRVLNALELNECGEVKFGYRCNGSHVKARVLVSRVEADD